MKQLKQWFLVCLFFTTLLLITFNCVWQSNMIFTASDLNIGKLAEIKNYLPESLTGIYRTGPILGVSGSSFILFKILLFLIPLEVFANSIYGIILFIGSISMVWFLRIWNLGWIPSIFAALISFWFNSITLASAGHAYKMEVLSFSILALAFLEKSIRCKSLKSAFGFNILAGLVIGFMMIEQQDVALIAILFLAAYSIHRLIIKFKSQFSRWALTLFSILIVSFSISGSTVLSSYERNIGNASVSKSNDSEKWDYITQWSMVPSEVADIIAPGWSGWYSGHNKYPYWGKIGQSSSYDEKNKQGFKNFKLNSNYIGIIPFIILIPSLVLASKNRKDEESKIILFLFFLGLIGLFLSFGKYSYLYKIIFQIPLLNDIRAPIKFLDNTQIILGILSGFGLNFLYTKNLSNLFYKRILLFVSSLIITLILTIFWVSISAQDYYGISIDLVNRMKLSWLHSLVLTIVVSFSFLLIFYKKFRFAGLLLIFFVSLDSLLLTSKYFTSSSIEKVKNNPIAIYLNNIQKDNRIYFTDQSGIYNSWLAIDSPYHDLNTFNFWQMPRMSSEDERLLQYLPKYPLKIWDLTSVKYIIAPLNIVDILNKLGETNNFQVISSFEINTPQGKRVDAIIDYKSSIPRLSQHFFWKYVPLDKHCDYLFKTDYNIRESVLVSKEIPKSSVLSEKSRQLEGVYHNNSVKVNIESDRYSIIRFSQKYQPEWSVLLNEKEVEVLQLDYMCMGVLVPPGKNNIEFRVDSGKFQFRWFAGSTTFFTILGLFLILKKKNA